MSEDTEDRISEVLERLEAEGDPGNVEGMKRFGIRTDKIFGVKVPVLRAMAGELDGDHDLALGLWQEGYRETRILATMVGEVDRVTGDQVEEWLADLDNWEVCDHLIMNLFERLPGAYDRAVEWSRRDDEFGKRAGFVMMARLAVSDKKAEDRAFEAFFPHIRRGAEDGRKMIRKGVSWALRQIGKRNLHLNAEATELAREMKGDDSSDRVWVAKDVLKDITRDSVIERLEKRQAGAKGRVLGPL